ncbi:MAG: beta-galactosidase trimerization domain-containing protein [Eisenbergiella massiliensis]
MDELANYYTALYDNNISVDIISAQDPLDDYKVVIAPVMYMTKPGADEKIRKFVSEGGTFVTTFLSGLVDEHDLVITGGYPGKLRDILGIWVEETDALPSYMKNSFSWNGKDYDCGLICDIMHMETHRPLPVMIRTSMKEPLCCPKMNSAEPCLLCGNRAGQDFYADFLNKVLKSRRGAGFQAL